ncbi:MAG: S1 RNA-binding domain-containing protein [Lentisphaerae bacterium]|nr:S1 RNA-binding domain-containing protein [Lentisphaerota bacterium]
MTQDNNKDFGRLFEAGLDKLTTTLRTGQRVQGVVSMIGKSSVFVDLGTPADGYLDRKDLLDKNGELTVKVGDSIDAFCMGWTDDGIKLALRMSGDAVDSSVEDAYNAGMPVEGKVTAERKGGFTVQVANSEAFCPFSQIDARGVKKEPAEYIGERFSFAITEYSEGGRNIVLSRRRILEKEAAKKREELKEHLAVGDIVDGVVTKIMPFGAFVDIGGVEGMVHVSEMGWNRGLKPEEVVSEGQAVQVKVLDIDWGDAAGDKRERLAFSIKQIEQHPWERVAEDESYAVGSKRRGKVTRLADFGAFIELEPGIEGLAHISQLGAEGHVKHPSEVVKEGDMVDVTLLDVDPERRRIGLCIGEPKVKGEKAAELTHEEAAEVAVVNAGQRLEGEVESVKPFGVFIKLPNGQTGLLHISQTGLAGDGTLQVRALYKAYPLRSKVQVIIREIAGNRISLTLPETMEQELGRLTVTDHKDSQGASFGSLDDVFGGLKL